ncbi:sdr family [Fusarium sporotrichioides]|uniref:Sdr family n=1 Tax=Fusarium sporotrichioides TaxID=5514 RepID=A0A395SBW0_FUSSP|nr:sdr family [Fusarium sporotrichioides]
MGKIAVAGGSSGLGRTMVEALMAAKTHDYIVLSRKAINAEARAVDYSSVDTLVSLLVFEQIDTVISCLPIDSDDSGRAQLNLIEAANRSKCTKRFLPSEFGAIYTRDIIHHMPFYRWKFEAIDMLEKTDLEFSLVSIGQFLDYWAAPRIPSYVGAANLQIDAASRAAIIPGDGKNPVVMTHSIDAAKFTVALLDLTSWKSRYSIIGNRLTLNEAVKLAEEVMGVKFDVKYFSIEDMEKSGIELTPSMQRILPEEMHEGMRAVLSGIGIGMAKGNSDIQGIEDLTVMLPNLKPLTVRSVWEAWK